MANDNNPTDPFWVVIAVVIGAALGAFIGIATHAWPL